jgi:hypothetical protein
MTTPATAWLGYALLAAAGIVAMVAPRGQRERRVAEAFLLGPLVVALAMLGASVAGVRCTRASIAAIVGGALLVRLIVTIARRRGGDAEAPREREGAGPLWLASGAGLLAAASALAEPINFSDPVAIYAPAAAQYAGHGRVDPALLRDMSEVEHRDYPPLFPSNLAWLYLCAGRYDPWIGKLLGPWFLLGLVLQVAVLARRLGVERGRTWLAALVLVPALRAAATNGFADVIVTGYLAGFLVALLDLARGDLPRGAALVRAMLFGAGAALTKNEGFAACVVFAALALALKSGDGRRVARRDLLLALTPTVLLSGGWWLATQRAGLTNDLVAGLPGVPWRELPERLGVILRSLASEVLARDEVPPRLPIWGLLPIAAAIAGVVALIDLARRRRLSLEHALAPAQVLLFVVVLAMTPYDVRWHVASALDRLLVQCVPALLVLVLAVASPLANTPITPSPRTTPPPPPTS